MRMRCDFIEVLDLKEIHSYRLYGYGSQFFGGRISGKTYIDGNIPAV